MADVKETRVPTGTALDPWAYTCFKTCIFGLAKKCKVAIRSVHRGTAGTVSRDTHGTLVW